MRVRPRSLGDVTLNPICCTLGLCPAMPAAIFYVRLPPSDDCGWSARNFVDPGRTSNWECGMDGHETLEPGKRKRLTECGIMAAFDMLRTKLLAVSAVVQVTICTVLRRFHPLAATPAGLLGVGSGHLAGSNSSRWLSKTWHKYSATVAVAMSLR